MAGQSKQKNKLLVIKQLLEQKTDENHALTVQDIIGELASRRISCERKTVYDDIATLQDFGMDIVVSKKGHSNAYYLASRQFQTEELFILSDAVASSKFLTRKKSSELISKLQDLTSNYIAPKLSREVFVNSRVKAFNESIYYNINSIHEAIKSGQKITFRYYYYDLEKRKKLRHGGFVYKVSPKYLAWEEDKYYLICYCEKHEDIARYRIDRMERVSIIDEKAVSLTPETEAIAKAQLSVYSMYGGEEKSVSIEFDQSLVDAVIDRFGTKVNSRITEDGKFRISVDVQISPPFWGWLFQFGDKAKIVAPKDIVAQAQYEISKIAKLYTNSDSTEGK